MSFFEVRCWLAKYKSLQKDDNLQFAEEININVALINEIYVILNDPKHQDYGSVYHQLYEIYRSQEKKLKVFSVQFIPTLIYTYLREHSRLKGFEPDVFSKLESFLMALYNMSIVDGILKTDTDGLEINDKCEIFYPLNYPSIYHDPQFYPLNSVLEHSRAFVDFNTVTDTQFIQYPQFTGASNIDAIHNNLAPATNSCDYLTFAQSIPTELLFNINSENRFELLTALFYVYNMYLVNLPLQSLKLTCLVIIDLCLSSFQEFVDPMDRKATLQIYNKASVRLRRSVLGQDQFRRYMSDFSSHGASGKLVNRIAANQNLYSQCLRAIYFCLYNGASDIALEALDAINVRSSYHLFPKALLMVSCIKNSIIPPISTQLAGTPGLSVADRKSAIIRQNLLIPEDYEAVSCQLSSQVTSPLALYLSSVPMTMASKNAITNASFKLKKLPEDISPLLPPVTAGHHKMETVREEEGSASAREQSVDREKGEREKKISKTQAISRLKDGSQNVLVGGTAIATDHHVTTINALSSFLPSGAAKFWAKTFSIEPSTATLSGPNEKSVNGALNQQVAGPTRYSGSELPAITSGATKRPSTKNISGGTTSLTPPGLGNAIHTDISQELGAKTKKNLLQQVKTKLKDFQQNQLQGDDGLKKGDTSRTGLTTTHKQLLHTFVPTTVDEDQTIINMYNTIQTSPQLTTNVLTSGKRKEGDQSNGYGTLLKNGDTGSGHSDTLVGEDAFTKGKTDQEHLANFTLGGEELPHHVKESGIVPRGRKGSAEAKEKEKFNLGKKIMKEFRDLGKDTKEKSDVNKELFRDKGIFNFDRESTSPEHVQTPSNVTEEKTKTKQKKSKEQTGSMLNTFPGIGSSSGIVGGVNGSALNKSYADIMDIEESGSYPHIEPSLPPLSPSPTPLPESLGDKDFLSQLVGKESSVTTQTEKERGNELTRMMKKLTRKKSDSNYSIIAPLDVASGETTSIRKQTSNQITGYPNKRVKDRFRGTSPFNEHNDNIQSNLDEKREVTRGVGSDIRFNPRQLHQPSIRPIISDDDDDDNHLGNKVVKDSGQPKQLAMFDGYHDGMGVKKQSTVANPFSNLTVKNAEEGASTAGKEDESKKKKVDIFGSPEERKAAAKKIKAFFDTALANVKEEFELSGKDSRAKRLSEEEEIDNVGVNRKIEGFGKQSSPAHESVERSPKFSIKQFSGADVIKRVKRRHRKALDASKEAKKEKFNNILAQLLDPSLSANETGKFDPQTQQALLNALQEIAPNTGQSTGPAFPTDTPISKEGGSNLTKKLSKNLQQLFTQYLHDREDSSTSSESLSSSDPSLSGPDETLPGEETRKNKSKTSHNLFGIDLKKITPVKEGSTTNVSTAGSSSDSEGGNFSDGEFLKDREPIVKYSLAALPKPKKGGVLQPLQQDIDEESFISDRFNRLQKLQNKRRSRQHQPKNFASSSSLAGISSSHPVAVKRDKRKNVNMGKFEAGKDDINKFFTKLAAKVNKASVSQNITQEKDKNEVDNNVATRFKNQQDVQNKQLLSKLGKQKKEDDMADENLASTLEDSSLTLKREKAPHIGTMLQSQNNSFEDQLNDPFRHSPQGLLRFDPIPQFPHGKPDVIKHGSAEKQQGHGTIISQTGGGISVATKLPKIFSSKIGTATNKMLSQQHRHMSRESLSAPDSDIDLPSTDYNTNLAQGSIKIRNKDNDLRDESQEKDNKMSHLTDKLKKMLNVNKDIPPTTQEQQMTNNPS